MSVDPERVGLDGGRRLGGPSCAACKGMPGWAPPTIDPMGGEIGGQIGAPPGGEWRVNYGQNRGFPGAQWAAKKDFMTAAMVSRKCLGWG